MIFIQQNESVVRHSVTAQEIQRARTADLYAFLRCHYADRFSAEGNSLRMRDNHSISIAKGYCGYTDFSSGEKGNSIDFLTRHLRYDFVQAVLALTVPENIPAQKASEVSVHRTIHLPEIYPGSPERVIQYLLSRNIPLWMSRALIRRQLLYQEAHTNNAVFLSHTRDFAELRGTIPGKTFHQCRKAKPSCYWSFSSHMAPPVLAFVCEGSIDAVSLYLLHYYRQEYTDIPVLYCGIGGVTNDQAIAEIAALFPMILAVDHDEAGERCRKKYRDYAQIIPEGKDWNDDLILFSRTADLSEESAHSNFVQ